MLLIKYAFLFCFFICFSASMYGENLASIMKAREEKAAKAKKSYNAAIKKVNKYTIKRLDQLKKATTRAGKLEEAIEIQNEINRLQGKPPLTAKKVDDGEEMEGGIPLPPGEDAVTFSKKQAKKALKKRYVKFYETLVQNKLDKALKYLDPTIRKGVDKTILKGHLKIIAGILQAVQVKKGGIGIERVKFSDKLKEAKITGKTRSAITNQWSKNETPNYWIYKRGEWYLGDENKLKKLF